MTPTRIAKKRSRGRSGVNSRSSNKEMENSEWVRCWGLRKAAMNHRNSLFSNTTEPRKKTTARLCSSEDDHFRHGWDLAQTGGEYGANEGRYDRWGGGVGRDGAAARLKLPLNLISILPAAENMPGGRAMRPGDVVKTLSGKTVEVQNTDAEGRLILSDGLAYATRFKPAALIDIATLTGACVVALGQFAIGMFGTDATLKEAIRQAGLRAGERVWEMPLWEEYFEQLRSDVADMRNIGGRGGGMITAALFLSKFVGDVPWAHLDIASTDWSERERAYIPKGPTGIGTRLLIQFLINRSL